MACSDYSLLTNYMSLGNVVNSQDASGNTLLHYAVALGQLQTVRILCTKSVN